MQAKPAVRSAGPSAGCRPRQARRSRKTTSRFNVYHKLLFGEVVIEGSFLCRDAALSTVTALDFSKTELDISARVEYGRLSSAFN